MIYIQLDEVFDLEVMSTVFTNQELFAIFLLINKKIDIKDIKSSKVLDLVDFVNGKNQRLE